MKIELKKATNYQCKYTLIREDTSVELITLETKTYLLHDVCHYVVEKNLEYRKGFWGMLSSGYSFESLFGKDNPQTTELKFIEQIVGPVQSAHSGHIPSQDFDQFMKHLNFKMPEGVLDTCLSEIKDIMQSWEQLPVGQHITLDWKL